MIFLSELILLVLAVLVAWYQACLIRNGRPIYHGWWALGWSIAIGSTMWLLWKPWLHEPPSWGTEMSGDLIPWIYGAAAGCGHLVLFNVCLNRFRGLKWNYTSISTGSILDQLAVRLFGTRFWYVEILLGVLWALMQPFFI